MATKARSLLRSRSEFLLVVLLSLFIVAPGLALAQTPFYQGKTITIVQGRDPGGTGDMRVRAMMPFLQKYIPGNPTIVNEYMPGGGSRKAANHVYKSGALTGSRSATSALAWFLLLYLESRESYTISTSLSIWVRPLAAITRFCNPKGGWAKQHRKTPSCRRELGSAANPWVSLLTSKAVYSPTLSDLKEPRFVTGYGGAELDPALDAR